MQQALSVYLDFIRFFAALTVFIVHANYERFTGGLPFLWRFADLGNDAVMAFFVLSGFVISYVANSREKDVVDYFSSRLSRLWSVVVPAIILTFVADQAGRILSPDLYKGWWYEDSNPILRVLINLFFVNEIWFSSTRLFSNGPLWSIGYEFWYYVIFGVFFYFRNRTRLVYCIGVAFLVGPKILLLLPVWLMGVWAYNTKLAERLSARTAIALFFTTIFIYIALRVSGSINYLNSLSARISDPFDLAWSRYFISSYIIGILIAMNFIAARTIAARNKILRIPFDRVIVYLSGFTFSLYLFHYPLLQFFAAVADSLHFGPEIKRSFVPAGALLLIWIFGGWVERQKRPLKKKVRHFMLKTMAPRSYPST